MHCVGCDSTMIEGQQEYECDFCDYTGCSDCMEVVRASGMMVANPMACRTCIEERGLEVICC